jgi:hypothetical protein
MTFKEAKELKDNIGETIEYHGDTYTVLVVPSEEDLFKKYLSIERPLKTTDLSAMKYSKDFTLAAVLFRGGDSKYVRYDALKKHLQ